MVGLLDKYYNKVKLTMNSNHSSESDADEGFVQQSILKSIKIKSYKLRKIPRSRYRRRFSRSTRKMRRRAKSIVKIQLLSLKRGCLVQTAESA